MAIDIVARALAVSGKQNLENYYTKTESDAKYSQATNLENGTGTGSLVQKRLKSDGVTWTTAKAYQGAGAAFGGGTQAGMTFEEWKNDNPTGTQEDYDKSYSFAFAANEDNKALSRGSAAFGRYNTAHNKGEFVCGNYAEENRNAATVFIVGGGVSSTKRHNAFEVRSDHSVPDVYESEAFVDGKVLATQEYVNHIVSVLTQEQVDSLF